MDRKPSPSQTITWLAFSLTDRQLRPAVFNVGHSFQEQRVQRAAEPEVPPPFDDRARDRLRGPNSGPRWPRRIRIREEDDGSCRWVDGATPSGRKSVGRAAFWLTGNPYWRGRLWAVDLPILTNIILHNKLPWWGGQSYWAFPFS